MFFFTKLQIISTICQRVVPPAVDNNFSRIDILRCPNIDINFTGFLFTYLIIQFYQVCKYTIVNIANTNMSHPIKKYQSVIYYIYIYYIHDLI